MASVIARLMGPTIDLSQVSCGLLCSLVARRPRWSLAEDACWVSSPIPPDLIDTPSPHPELHCRGFDRGFLKQAY